MENLRTYNSIRLFRGKRKEAELLKLADAERDFEFRRLYITERELDLHVAFSREIVCLFLSWIFLLQSYFFYQFNVLSIIFIIISTISFLSSQHYHSVFKKTFRKYKLSLSFVDAVILNDYGINLS